MKNWLKNFTRRHKLAIAIIQVLFLGFIAEMVLGGIGHYQVNTAAAEAFSRFSTYQGQKLTVATSQNEVLSKQLADITAKNPNPTPQEIESYIKTIFGKDAPTAIGIAHHECWTWSKQFPGCVHLSAAEDSIGIMQINLHNSHQNIHASRIPGANMTQKEEWLKNPFQNVLYSFWVFKTSGFEPWSTFTSKAYLH